MTEVENDIALDVEDGSVEVGPVDGRLDLTVDDGSLEITEPAIIEYISVYGGDLDLAIGDVDGDITVQYDDGDVTAQIASTTDAAVVTLVVSAGGGNAATDIDTSPNKVDFLPWDVLDWMGALPEPFSPSEYWLYENVVFFNGNFVRYGTYPLRRSSSRGP
ncbi:hypothetical protein [Halosimplex halobium]|uniref:hypothetical protein n=1 Tax=Halosimplex halobium TaxID=3396618 RepID=UPI003F56FD9E